MEEELTTSLPQGGSGTVGEYLPVSSSGSPLTTGGGKISKTSERNSESASLSAKASTGNKIYVQQAFHPALFVTRPRSASVGAGQTHTPAKESTNKEAMPSTSSYPPCPPTWQRVPASGNKKRKLSASPPTETTRTSNRFTGLPIDLTDDNENTTKPSKPPPIILYGVEELDKLTELLETVVEKDQFTYKIVNKTQLRISTTNIEVYKKLITLVRDNGLIGHTFHRKDNRGFRIVIKNLHPSTPLNIIKEDIEATGNIVAGEIINARYGPEKKPTSTFFVNLAPGPNNKTIKNLKYFYHQSVIIEEPKKRKTSR